MEENLKFGQEDCRAELQCIGLRIAYFRRLNNLTQGELAERLHINKNYLSHIESGSANKTVSLPLLIKISRALDVELAVLVDLDDMHNKNCREFVKDMRDTFEELKQLNSDLDKMLEQLNEED